MQKITKSYQKILIVTTHTAFICYTLGYFMGLLDYLALGYINLVIEDFTIIGMFLITYMFFIFNKISLQTSMKILSVLVVLDMLYPGILFPGQIPTISFHEETVAMDLILVFVVAFTTSKKFAVFITVSIVSMIVVNAFLFNNTVMLKILPTVVLCIGGMGVFSIIFENLIKGLLEQANESKNKIQELSDYKQNITRHVIHDLKVPVSSILNLSSGKEDMSAKKIYSQANDINKQLEKILDVERLEEANILLSMEPVSVNRLIEKSVLSVKILARDKNIAIVQEINTTGELLCDADLTERLIVNILSNAVKYTPLNGHILITANSNENNCQITVKDNGTGISEEHLKHIFEKFYFINAEKSGTNFSTGLGLAFCKLVADVHNGEIKVKSELGKGTEFDIILPGYKNDNLVTDITKELSQEMILTAAEREFLGKTCRQIKDIPVYSVSEIVRFTQHLANDKRENIQYWYERFSDAVYTGNSELYGTMIQSCI